MKRLWEIIEYMMDWGLMVIPLALIMFAYLTYLILKGEIVLY